MLKFMMFSRKSARKMGLLVLLLSLAAAPRAWGGFEVTGGGSVKNGNYYFSDAEEAVLIISADALTGDKEAVISGDGRSIVVTGSDVRLTLQNLTAETDDGPAFWLDSGSADIRIVGAVTFKGGEDGFLVSVDPVVVDEDARETLIGTVILDVVSEDSILKASGGGDGIFHGLHVRQPVDKGGDGQLILHGDGKFSFTGSRTGNGLKNDMYFYMHGSAALSAAAGAEGVPAIHSGGMFFLFENAKIDSADYGIENLNGEVAVADNASIAEGISVTSSRGVCVRVRVKAEPSGVYLIKMGSYVSINPDGWGEGWIPSGDILPSLFSFSSQDNAEEPDPFKKIAALLIGRDSRGPVSIDSVEARNSDGKNFFLVSFDMPATIQDKAVSIRYETETGPESESEESSSYPVSGNSVTIKAATRNIPAGQYTVALHGASDDISLTEIVKSPAPVSTTSNIVTRGVPDNPVIPGNPVKYGDETDAELIFTLAIPEGLPLPYKGLSFSMKEEEKEEEEENKFDYNNELDKQVMNSFGAVPSTLWLPAFALVEEVRPPKPEPTPSPEPSIIIFPPDDLPVPPETPADIAGVSVATEDGESRDAQKQPDGVYLAVLPAGSDLASAVVSVKLPNGETFKPHVDLSDWDFSKGPLEIPVTADGVEKIIRIDVKLEPLSPDIEDLLLVNPDPTKWLLNARWEKNGSYSAAVAAPFTPEAAERGELPSRLLVTLEGLSNVGLSVVWVEGRKGKMLCIGGTAEDWEALTESLSVSRIEFGYGEGDVTYRQTFDPPVTFGLIPEENRYMSLEPPEPVVVEKGGGCDAGFGAGLATLALLAACLAARKSAAKKAR